VAFLNNKRLKTIYRVMFDDYSKLTESFIISTDNSLNFQKTNTTTIATASYFCYIHNEWRSRLYNNTREKSYRATFRNSQDTNNTGDTLLTLLFWIDYVYTYTVL